MRVRMQKPLPTIELLAGAAAVQFGDCGWLAQPAGRTQARARA